MIFELSALMFMLHNATPMMQVMIVDTYVETHVTYVYSFYPRQITTSTGYKYGDCTEKAQLVCTILSSRNITCRPAHGYGKNTKGVYVKHDYYTYVVDGNQYFSCEYPTCVLKGEGVW